MLFRSSMGIMVRVTRGPIFGVKSNGRSIEVYCGPAGGENVLWLKEGRKERWFMNVQLDAVYHFLLTVVDGCIMVECISDGFGSIEDTHGTSIGYCNRGAPPNTKLAKDHPASKDAGARFWTIHDTVWNKVTHE